MVNITRRQESNVGTSCLIVGMGFSVRSLTRYSSFNERSHRNVFSVGRPHVIKRPVCKRCCSLYCDRIKSSSRGKTKQ